MPVRRITTECLWGEVQLNACEARYNLMPVRRGTYNWMPVRWEQSRRVSKKFSKWWESNSTHSGSKAIMLPLRQPGVSMSAWKDDYILTLSPTSPRPCLWDLHDSDNAALRGVQMSLEELRTVRMSFHVDDEQDTKKGKIKDQRSKVIKTQNFTDWR